MYRNAEVLVYKNKKIWIKNVNKYVYCVNGKFIAFHDKQNIENADILADSLDMFYSPLGFHADRDDSILLFSLGKDNKNIVNNTYLSNCTFDISNAKNILAEYKEWANSNSDIYINDCRHERIEAWLDMHISAL